MLELNTYELTAKLTKAEQDVCTAQESLEESKKVVRTHTHTHTHIHTHAPHVHDCVTCTRTARS